jgi:hypothetical protein
LLKKIIFKLLGVAGLIAVGFVMNYQYERILGILTGESHESAIAIDRTEVDWAESCKVIVYKDYGRTLEEVLLAAFAFSINDTFPKNVNFSIISSEWQLKNKFYRLSARTLSAASDSYSLSLLESDTPDFALKQELRLPYKWVGRLSRGEVLRAFENYEVQLLTSSPQSVDIETYVDFSLDEISTGSTHKFTVRNNKIYSWEFPVGLCQVELNEPIYRNVARCKCS